jgi:hypothetical protein
MMDRVASGSMTEEGVLEETIEVSIYRPFGGAVVTLRLPEGTTALGSQGNCLQKIIVDEVLDPPAVPEKWYLIETAYDFRPADATFDPPIELIMYYDHLLLPEAVSEWDLSIGYYNRGSAEWVLLSSIVDTAAHTVTTSTSHFTVFAIIGTTVTPPLVISDISVYATDDVATVSWTTDNPSTSQVEYWVITSPMSSVDTAMVTKHTVAVTDLTPETTYYFKVISSDDLGNLAISDEHTFTTGSAPAAINWWLLIGGIIGGAVVAVVLAWYFGWHRGGPLWHWWWRRKA